MIHVSRPNFNGTFRCSRRSNFRCCPSTMSADDDRVCQSARDRSQRSRLGYLVFNSQASGSMSTDNVTSITVFMYVCIASPFEESGSHARFSGRSAVSADLITTDEAEENVRLLILHRKQALQENSSTHRGTHNTYTHRMIAGHIGPDHMRYCS